MLEVHRHIKAILVNRVVLVVVKEGLIVLRIFTLEVVLVVLMVKKVGRIMLLQVAVKVKEQPQEHLVNLMVHFILAEVVPGVAVPGEVEVYMMEEPVALAVAVEVVQEVVVVGLLLELLARLTQAAVEVGAVAALVLHPVVVEPKEWEVVVELV